MADDTTKADANRDLDEKLGEAREAPGGSIGRDGGPKPTANTNKTKEKPPEKR